MPAAGVDLPRRVVVVGAGTMGARIAVCFAREGVDVCVTARRAESLADAARTIASCVAQADAESPGGSSPGGGGSAEAIEARIRLTTDATSELAEADLVIESIREDLGQKITLLKHVGAHVPPTAVVATNTSSLDLDILAGAVDAPGRFAGLHWFNPADLVELVEVVAGARTEPETVELLRGWMARLGKVPVLVCRAVPGFIANRLQYALMREAYALVADGVCGWSDIDIAVTNGLGPRWASLGPFQNMDLAGLDVHVAVARALYPALATDQLPPAALVDHVARGWLGAKSGHGLLGEYTEEQVARLTSARDMALRRWSQFRSRLAGDIEE